MILDLSWLSALCTPGEAARGGLLLGLFAAGAAGSVMHCAPMCGPFVLGQMSDRMARLPAARLCEWQRVRNGLLLPYHLGRLTTYGLLGAVGAASAGVLGQAAWFSVLSACLLIVAAILFLAHAVNLVLPGGGGWRLDRAPARLARFIGTWSRRIPRGSAGGEYLLGIALGFLPCGLLYAALMAAAATARPEMGAASMVAFGLGTMPTLILIGIAGQAVASRWQRLVGSLAPGLMVLNAGLLLLLAWQHLAA